MIGGRELAGACFALVLVGEANLRRALDVRARRGCSSKYTTLCAMSCRNRSMRNGDETPGRYLEPSSSRRVRSEASTSPP